MDETLKISIEDLWQPDIFPFLIVMITVIFLLFVIFVVCVYRKR